MLIMLPLFSTVTLTGCDGGGGGGAAENTGNDDTGGGGGGAAENTGNDDTGGTEPEVRIVLANAMYTAATNDIEPTAIANSTVSWGQTGPNIYDETFNTLYFDGSQFEPGKKYIFNGELDSEGKVKDKVRISGNVTDIDIVINNAIVYAPNFFGNSKLTFDMPHGPIKPIAPLDKVPVLEADTISTETVIVAPVGAKKRIAGEAPVNI